MRSLLIRKPDAVLWLLASYFLLQFAVRLVMPDGLRYDESQQAFFSQWLTWGYDSQPPLYNWVQAAFVSIFGLSVASIAVIKNFALFLLYATYYRLAREVLTDRLYAVIATLSLLLIPQIAWEAQRDLTHTVALVITINLFLLFAVRVIKAPAAWNYIALGLFAGLGMLSKYNFALIPIAVFVAVAAHPRWRQRLIDRRILLAAITGFLVTFPHALWLIDNLAIASGRTLGIMAQDAPDTAFGQFIQGPIRFIRITLIILAPLFGVYLLVFRREGLRSLKQSTDWTRFFDRIFLTLVIVIFVLIVAIGMTALRDRWLMPFIALVPIWLCLKLEAEGVQSQSFASHFLAIPLIVMLVVPVVLLARTNLPGLFGSYQAYNMPYGAFVNELLNREGKRPGLVITPSWLPAGNLHLHMPDVPVMSTFFGNLVTDYLWGDESPILLVWLTDDDQPSIPSELTVWLDREAPDHGPIEVRVAAHAYQHAFNASLARFAYAWISPR